LISNDDEHNGGQRSSGDAPASHPERTTRVAPKPLLDAIGVTINRSAPRAPRQNETPTTPGGQPHGRMGSDSQPVLRHVCYDHLCHGSLHADLYRLNGNTEQHLRTLYPEGAIVSITTENGYHKVTFRGEP